MLSNHNNKFPAVLGGIVLALMLILFSSRGKVDNPALMERFAPRPTDPNAPTSVPFEFPQIDLSGLPPQVQQSLESIRKRFLVGEAVQALTPVAAGPRVQTEVREVKRAADQVQIQGSVKNISNAPITIPPGAFSFRDSAGITYATGGTTSVLLQPGQSTTFNLGVPLPEDRGLILILTLPPDAALSQVLIPPKQ